MKKQFVMSMFSSEKELLKAKCAYLEREVEKLENVAVKARELFYNSTVDSKECRQLFLALVAAEVLDPQLKP